MSECYKGARTLYSFEYLGETFRVVRRRFDGRHWRGYLMLLHGDVPMIDNDFKVGNAVAAGNQWHGDMERTFKTREQLVSAIAEVTERYQTNFRGTAK